MTLRGFGDANSGIRLNRHSLSGLFTSSTAPVYSKLSDSGVVATLWTCLEEGISLNRVEGKVVIVTGGASGLGAADARMLAIHGAQVVLTDVDAEGGRAVAEETGGEFIEQDVSDEQSWPALIDGVMEKYGKLDVLVNNAGIAPIGTVESTTTEVWHRVLAIHLDGMFFGCRAAIPAMKKGGGGSIINMSSTAAMVGHAPYFAYAAAKGGIRSMTKSMAIHCRDTKTGVRCNSIHPGSINTPMVQESFKALAGIELKQDADPETIRTTMGVGQPEDVANMVLYLASDESRHVTGAEMMVDFGGSIV